MIFGKWDDCHFFHLLRSLLVVAMMVCGVGSSLGQTNYVFFSSNNFAAYLGTGTAISATTDFVPNQCIWIKTTNNNRTYIKGYKSYYFYPTRSWSWGSYTYSIAVSTTKTTLTYGNNSEPYTVGGNNCYLRYNNGWVGAASTNATACAYVVSSVEIPASISTPTIAGINTTLSSINETASFTGSSIYSIACTKYSFGSGTNEHIYYSTDDSQVASTSAPTTTDGITYEWSLSDNLKPYASISNGTVTVTSLPTGSDVSGTVKCRAKKTVNNVDVYSDYAETSLTIEYLKKLPTTLTFAAEAPTISADGWNVQLPAVTLKSGDTTLENKTIKYSATGCSVNETTGVLSSLPQNNSTVTVTASFAGDDDYAASQATYTITVTEHAALNEVTVADIAITPATATLDLNGTQDYSVPSTTTGVTRTCEQYTEYACPTGAFYKYASVGWQYSTTAPTVNEQAGATVNLTQVNWAVSEGGTKYFALSTYSSQTSNSTTLTRNDTKTAEDKVYTITATATYGSAQKTATAKVTIPTTLVDLTAIHPSPSNYTLATDETVNIAYTYEPNHDEAGKAYVNVTYTGYDTSIISVDAGGKITGLAEGTTTVTIQSIKIDGTNGVSATVTVEVSNGNGNWDNPYRISSVAGLAKMNDNDKKGKAFLVTADIDASTFKTEITDFSGTLDGNFKRISGLKQAIFNTITGGTVKNVILDNVNITRNGDVGAIANQASGSSKIYNCGVLSKDDKSSITCTQSGSSAGGLVGYAYGNTRVINCYSYADVAATSNAGGIVGYVSNASTNTNVQTMVMNCMFYGNITQGTTIAPIYGGNIISNEGSSGLNNFNYFRYESPYSVNGNINTYNCALAAEERYLTRFEFYRLQLNSNKELAAWYATGSTANGAQMAKWVLDKSIAPYPILKPQGKYPSIINIDAANATTQTERNKGGLLGTLSLSISQDSNAPQGANITQSSLTLNITDKDEDNYNYNYRKVQLPYYNEVGTGNYTNNKVVTGWKVTVSGGTNTFSTGTDAPAYNFADPKCTDKDNFKTSGRVFAQGAYFNVPDGVTSISIQPYWGNAVYLSDPNYDLVYSTSYDATDVTTMGTRYQNGNSYSINGSSQKVYTSLSNAFNNLSTGTSVYDNAIVLVGNYHQYCGSTSAFNNSTKAVTIMSADLDMDNEPDYSFIYQHTDRLATTSVRFDFLNWPGIGMVQKVTGTTRMPNQGIFAIQNWFEVTNTCVARFTEFEYDDGKSNSAPLILLGGIYEQITSAHTGTPTNTTYIHLGDNAWFKEFQNGTHADGGNATAHNPISVTGGQFEKFYLTGTFKPSATAKTDNAECYINGGEFGELAGAGQEKINGDVTFLIDNADIDEFYGGGINDANPISGSISTTINNSYVTKFCGGPKFGDMASGQTVTTIANGTTFGTYFGAGNGGTSYYRDRKVNSYNSQDYSWSTYATSYFTRGDGTSSYGVQANYEYEYFAWAGGNSTNNVARFYTNYASLSFAQTKDVTSTLTDCTVLNDFYGGGNLGKVDGNATSVLNNCTIKGSAFAAGYSASIPTVKVFNQSAFQTEPSYNGNVGVYNQGVYPDYTEYTWSKSGSTSSTLTASDGKNYIYTDKSLEGLGAVSGEAKITINGGTVGGNVYGGGNESESKDNTSVALEGNAKVAGSVFGGGNKANVNTKPSTGSTVNINGGTVSDAVYGGGALANTGNTTVNLNGGSVGDVYGGGLGQLADAASGKEAVAATVGSTTVNVGSGTIADGVVSNIGETSTQIAGSVFGCNNLNGSPTGQASVYVFKTMAKGTEDEQNPYHIKAVYGGGNLAAYTPTGDNISTKVEVFTCENKIEDVFGGGNAAAVPTTDVTIWGGQMKRVFAGGNGTDAPANVNGDAKVTIHGGTISEVYGGSNTQGEITGTPYVTVSEQGNGTSTACSVDVTDLYGGGNMAPSGAGQISVGKCQNISNVYGGANQANVTGDISLDISDGHVGNLFGGNNNSGNITGAITINVNWADDAEASLGNVYGGGNIASYTGSPEVNIINTTMTGSVFGGGKGQSAVVVGDPTVNIGSWTEGTVSVGGSVFGGGDLAAVEGNPSVTIRDCNTVISCDLYGGGNAAPVYSTNTTVWGGLIAGNVFGGGNGKDATKNANGAQVGYQRDDTNIGGTGIATTNVYGGTIGTWNGDECTSGGGVFGGSNTNGNIRGKIQLTVDKQTCTETDATNCPIKVKEIYGAGNEAAYMGEGINFSLGCVDALSEIYGGAKEADLNQDVVLTIRSGRFKKVFGGNNLGGKLNGSITVNIEETGCRPIYIEELYGGGNQAGYSVYGYEDALDAEGKVVLKDSGTKLYNDPVVNIYSCSEIGKVFGGGYGTSAVMVGSPTVNVNQVKGTPDDVESSALGIIGTVFGGGNAAKVVGNTNVNIGTLKKYTVLSGTYEGTEKNILGANITGNVYGGGNNADVTGKTNVVIGADKSN